MQNNNTNSDAYPKNFLADLVYTKEDLVKTSQEIEALEKAIYHTDPQILEKTLSQDIREAFSSHIRELFLKNPDKKSVLEDLKKQLAAFQVMDLKIAFEPTHSVVEKVSQWVKANLGELVVVNFDYDPEVIAGAEISYGGKFVDLSLRKVVESVNV
jgi:F0F1-type ATP synthase delta subunit